MSTFSMFATYTGLVFLFAIFIVKNEADQRRFMQVGAICVGVGAIIGIATRYFA